MGRDQREVGTGDYLSLFMVMMMMMMVISQIYCNYIYTSKELYDMENREASDLAAVRAEKE